MARGLPLPRWIVRWTTACATLPFVEGAAWNDWAENTVSVAVLGSVACLAGVALLSLACACYRWHKLSASGSARLPRPSATSGRKPSADHSSDGGCSRASLGMRRQESDYVIMRPAAGDVIFIAASSSRAVDDEENHYLSTDIWGRVGETETDGAVDETTFKPLPSPLPAYSNLYEQVDRPDHVTIFPPPLSAEIVAGDEEEDVYCCYDPGGTAEYGGNSGESLLGVLPDLDAQCPSREPSVHYENAAIAIALEREDIACTEEKFRV